MNDYSRSQPKFLESKLSVAMVLATTSTNPVYLCLKIGNAGMEITDFSITTSW